MLSNLSARMESFAVRPSLPAVSPTFYCAFPVLLPLNTPIPRKAIAPFAVEQTTVLETAGTADEFQGIRAIQKCCRSDRLQIHLAHSLLLRRSGRSPNSLSTLIRES